VTTVTVVMANYNGARHIPAAVRSVLAQTVADLELIVVDDASTDDSLGALLQAAAGDPRVIPLAQPTNAGPAAARNRALDQAGGRWVAVVDSDDELEPDRLARLIAVAEAEDADIVCDDLLVFSDDAAAAHRFLPRGFAPRWITLADYLEAGVMYGPGPDLGFLKPLISARALGGLRYAEDLRIGEDYDLIVRLLAAGARLRLEPCALYRYRKHAGSISHRLSAERLDAMLAAQDRFQRAASELAPEAQRALDRRRRSLETAKIYEQVVAGVKSGAVASSLAKGLAHPRAWPLLAIPLKNRLRARA
jgi:succinoglycan biosynthesis protein ExoO